MAKNSEKTILPETLGKDKADAPDKGPKRWYKGWFTTTLATEPCLTLEATINAKIVFKWRVPSEMHLVSQNYKGKLTSAQGDLSQARLRKLLRERR